MSRPTRVVAFGLRGLDGVEGGIETHARELYPRLVALGLDVTVLVRRPHGRSGWFRGVRTRALWAPPGKGVEAGVHALLATAYCLLRRPDVVHVHGIGPGLFATVLRRAGLRTVVTHHGRDYDATKWGPLARALLRWGERRSVRDATRLVAVSHALAGVVEEQFGVAATVVGNGRPTWTGAEPEPAVRSEPFVLVVGRLTAHKRILDAIDALADPRLAGVRLVVCGDLGTDDPYRTAVQRAAAGQPRVELAGHQDAVALRALYRGAAATVMPSSYEGQPLAVLEAMAAGCPVLLSDIPAHRELALDPGQYAPVGDVRRLADALVDLLARPRADVAAGQSVRIGEDRFDWDHIAAATAAVLTGGPDPTAVRAPHRTEAGSR